LLAPAGLIVVQVPCIDSWGARLARRRWYHYGPPNHLGWFNHRSLSLLAESMGLRLVQAQWVRKLFHLGYLRAQLADRYLSGHGGSLSLGPVDQLAVGVPMSERLFVLQRGSPTG
jgi:hypothetical protein